jgi:hypothetical protein
VEAVFMAGERKIPGEDEMVREARALMPALPDREVRVGFAARVALEARDRRTSFAGWLRWSLGGLALAGTAAAALFVAVPAPRHDNELAMAEQLGLFEDLAVVQNQQALEDLEVVEVLHTLPPPEARP